MPHGLVPSYLADVYNSRVVGHQQVAVAVG